jgi:hypothetical protein
MLNYDKYKNTENLINENMSSLVFYVIFSNKIGKTLKDFWCKFF